MELGHYLEAEKCLNEFEIGAFSVEDNIIFEILNYRVQIGLHNYLEVLKVIDSTIQNIKQNNLKKELLQILHIKSFTLQFSNNLDESMVCAIEGIEIIEKMSFEKQIPYSIEYAYLLLQKGYINFYRLKYDETLAIAKKAQKLFEKSEYLIGVGEVLTLIGLVNYSQGNFPKAIEYINESLTIFKELKIIHQILNSYYYLNRLIYHQGQIHQALSYLEKMLELVRKYNDHYRLGVFLLAFSILQAEIGKFKLAEKNALTSLKHIEKTSREDLYFLLYYRLFVITINQNKISEAEIHFEKLLIHRKEFGENLSLQNFICLAEAQLEMKKGTNKGRDNAKLLLNDLITKDANRKEIPMEARYYLCNILLQEYLDSDEKMLLKELNKLTNEILEFGKKGELVGFRMKANHIRLLTVWIQQLHNSQSIKNTNVDELLLEVQFIADEHNLTTTTKQFTDQQMKLLQQKQTLEEFTKVYYYDVK